MPLCNGCRKFDERQSGLRLSTKVKRVTLPARALAQQVPFTKSPDAQACLFADFVYRRTNSQLATQVANVEIAKHLVVLIQIVLVETFKNMKPELEFLPGSGCGSCFGEGSRAARGNKLLESLRQSLGQSLKS